MAQHPIIRGLITDITLLGGAYIYISFYWEGYSSLFPDALHIPHSTESLIYDCTHMLVLRMLAFCFASKTDKRKSPHTCLYQPHGGYRLPYAGHMVPQQIPGRDLKSTTPFTFGGRMLQYAPPLHSDHCLIGGDRSASKSHQVRSHNCKYLAT
jgi:hypothetical protein